MGRRVVIMAGGTGGHVYPGLAVARELIDQGCEVHWLGTRSGLEARVVPEAGIKIHWLEVAGIRGKSWRGLVGAPWMLLKSLLQSGKLLREISPDVVLGMGGFVSGPGGLMAWLMGIPLVLHEQNRVPGTTNRWLSSRASRVLEAFQGSFPSDAGAIVVGNPVRREILKLKFLERVQARGRPVRIFVLGGSLGAKVLNEVVPEALARIEVPLEVWHQTGAALKSQTQELYRSLGQVARVDAFIEEMAEAYAWADLVICRAGAMTVSEIAIAGLPSVLIPFPHAIDDHQTRNAEVLVQAGAAELLPQTKLDAETLALEVESLLADSGRLEHMGIKARDMGRPDAAGDVAGICISLAESSA